MEMSVKEMKEFVEKGIVSGEVSVEKAKRGVATVVKNELLRLENEMTTLKEWHKEAIELIDAAAIKREAESESSEERKQAEAIWDMLDSMFGVSTSKEKRDEMFNNIQERMK